MEDEIERGWEDEYGPNGVMRYGRSGLPVALADYLSREEIEKIRARGRRRRRRQTDRIWTHLQYLMVRYFGPPVRDLGNGQSKWRTCWRCEARSTMKTFPHKDAYKDRFRCYGCGWGGDEIDLLRLEDPDGPFKELEQHVDDTREDYLRMCPDGLHLADDQPHPVNMRGFFNLEPRQYAPPEQRWQLPGQQQSPATSPSAATGPAVQPPPWESGLLDRRPPWGAHVQIRIGKAKSDVVQGDEYVAALIVDQAARAAGIDPNTFVRMVCRDAREQRKGQEEERQEQQREQEREQQQQQKGEQASG
jgi:hypothetical protein